jgi:hypothetical protein
VCPNKSKTNVKTGLNKLKDTVSDLIPVINQIMEPPINSENKFKTLNSELTSMYMPNNPLKLQSNSEQEFKALESLDSPYNIEHDQPNLQAKPELPFNTLESVDPFCQIIDNEACSLNNGENFDPMFDKIKTMKNSNSMSNSIISSMIKSFDKTSRSFSTESSSSRRIKIYKSIKQKV